MSPSSTKCHKVKMSFADGYGRDMLFHLVSGALESLLKPNQLLYYLYILKYVLVYSIWWSEALLWRIPFFFTACSWTS